MVDFTIGTFVLQLESIAIGLVLGFIIGFLAKMAKKPSKGKIKTKFMAIRGELKEGHEGLERASKAMHSLNEVLNNIDARSKK